MSLRLRGKKAKPRDKKVEGTGLKSSVSSKNGILYGDARYTTNNSCHPSTWIDKKDSGINMVVSQNRGTPI